MEQIAEQITEDLLQKLPDQAQFFTPDELLSSGVPHIVVKILRKNILSTVESELEMPESEWVQTEHEQVQAAWQSFVEMSRRYVRIPAAKLSNLLAEVVKQCLELALKPRQTVAEIIFRAQDTIDLETAKKRVDSLQVNKQLGVALLRYMEKKEKQEITLEKAQELIKKVDQRLIKNYHTLNWAQVLKPVFELAGPSVDSDLFRIFFQDKEKPAYARKFDQLDQALTETEFIEFLSSADMLDIDEEEDEQPELFVPVEEDAEPEKVVEIEEAADDESVITSEDDTTDEWGGEDQQQEVASNTTEDYKELDAEDEAQEEQPPVKAVESERNPEKDDETPPEKDKEEKNIVGLFSQIKNDDLLEEDRDEPMLSIVEDQGDSDDENENISLLSKFMFDESVDEALDEVPEEPNPTEQKEPTSIYEEMNLVKDDHSDVREKQNLFEESSEDEEETEEELSFKIEAAEEETNEITKEESIELEHEADDPEEDDPPMWRSFLERDDLETDSGYEYEEESEDEKEGEFTEEDEGFVEEPIYDLTTDEPDPEEKISKISGWLNDEKGRFIDEIFMGSEMAYEQALIEIMDFENWKAASMYLEQEVFSRNKVDVYDEAAVDFTDRLHSYFLEYNLKQDE